MIRFEIKDQVVEWFQDEYGILTADEAKDVIDNLMGLMIAHKCITVEQPAPDAALVEALRMVRRKLENNSEGVIALDDEEWDQIADALASVEQGGE